MLVALLILLPESVAAVAAARKNDLQKSINLALGSSLATIGLTIPAVAVAAYALDKQLVLGLNDQEMVLLVLTFVLSMLTFGTGRTNILFGLVHLVVFAVFRVPGVRARDRDRSDRCSAPNPNVQVDTPEVRVTEWRLAPGSATGHHIHEMDYVIVPVTSGEMTIVAPNGERSKAQLGGRQILLPQGRASSMTCSTRPRPRSCSWKSN